MTLATALSGLITRPVDVLLRRWNWKAALTSSVVRGAIFFVANMKSGWAAASGAMLAEWTYRAITSGSYGALTQTLGEVEPEWQGAACAMVVLPVLSHSVEFAVHRARHTPHLKTSIIASVVFTVFSTLFNLFAMRRGTMIVGRGAPSLGDDLRAMPRVVASFLAALPLWAWRSWRGCGA